jgi:hypothetical protein
MFDELSLNILDMGMNSVAAGASIVQIVIIEDAKRDWLILRIRDNGRGMNQKVLQHILAKNLSTKAHRRKPIGLGVAMLRQTSEMCGGTFHIRSVSGKGTTVTASMRLSHVDRPPVGDLNSTILALGTVDPPVNVQLHYRSNGKQFRFSSQEGRHHEPRRTQKVEREGAAAGRAA